MKRYLTTITIALLVGMFPAIAQNKIENNMKKKQITSKTIVFVHGLFMNSNTWTEWKAFFEKAGYTCYTPDHPFHKGKPAELRASPPEGLGSVQFQDWIEQLDSLIDGLPEKPILIGHSFGGLTAQKLVEAGKAEAAILISSAPPKGISTFKPSFIKANNPVISPFKGKSVYNPKEDTYKRWFHYAITNTLTREQSDSLFESYAVPESRQTPRASLKPIAKIDTKKAHVPMLFVGGLEDVIIPNVLVRKTVKKYTDESSITDVKYFEGKDHFICGAPGWQNVAQYCLDWLAN